MSTRFSSAALRSYYFGLILLLYLPIALLFLFSVNSNASLSFPINRLTLDWYRQLFDADAVLRSARNSLVVALGSSLTATALGTMVSILLLRYKFRGQNLLPVDETRRQQDQNQGSGQHDHREGRAERPVCRLGEKVLDDIAV